MTFNVTNIIKELDFFGHPILLNFNNKGNTHKSLIGGLISLFIRFFMCFYVTLLIKTLVFEEDYNNSSITSSIKYSDLGKVPMNETKIVPYITVINGGNPFQKVDYEEA